MTTPNSNDESPFMAIKKQIGAFLYDPITNWQRCFNPQVGVFNQFAGNPEDEKVEAAVLQEVGSYGSQISTILEAVRVIRTQMIDANQLTSPQIRALSRFDCLCEDSQKVVSLHRPRLGVRDMELLVDYLVERMEKVIPREQCCPVIGVSVEQHEHREPTSPDGGANGNREIRTQQEARTERHQSPVRSAKASPKPKRNSGKKR